MIPTIFLFTGLCFLGIGDCIDNEPVLEEPISYLEFGSFLMAIDLNNRENIMRSDWDLSEQPNFGYDYVDRNMANISKGQFLSYNNNNYFLVTYWQLDENFITSQNNNTFVTGSSGSYEIINDNWQSGKTFTEIYGIHGISDNCPNYDRFICFDSKNTLVYLVHELDSVIRINEEQTVNMNSRITDSIRIDNDTVAFFFEPEGLMPSKEYHYILPLTTVAFSVELTEEKPCFWDKEPRICELEQKINSFIDGKIINSVQIAYAEPFMDLVITYKGEPYELSEAEMMLFENKMKNGECEAVTTCLLDIIEWYQHISKLEYTGSFDMSVKTSDSFVVAGDGGNGSGGGGNNGQKMLVSDNLDKVNNKITENNDEHEYGTIAMMILTVAIISIIAVSAKTRVIPRY